MLDKDWKLVFQPNITRVGASKNKSRERVMLTRVGGAEEIATSSQSNTVMKSRNNFPLFIETVVYSTYKFLRGFSIGLFSETIGKLFDPDDLLVQEDNFRRINHGYFVGSFSSTVNESVCSGRYWNDVWSTTATGVEINGISIQPLISAVHGQQGLHIPYIIPHTTASYGETADNSGAIKRVFAVHRDKVSAYTDGTATVPEIQLWPITPRADYKAMTGGVAIDQVAHKAKLSQLYFTGATWDSISSGWVISKTEVSMLLTAPYLTKVDSTVVVEQGTDTPSFVGNASGSTTQQVQLPDTEIGIICTGELGGFLSGTVQHVLYPWTGTLSKPMPGEVVTSYSQTIYEGVYSASSDGVVCSSTNNIYFRSNTEEKSQKGDVFVPTGWAETNYGGGDNQLYFTSPDEFHWGLYGSDGYNVRHEPQVSQGGSSQFYMGYGHSLGSASYSSKNQTGSFSVVVDSVQTISGSFSRYVESGNESHVTPKSGIWSSYLADPYGWVDVTVGFGSGHKRIFGGVNPPYQAAIDAEMIDWGQAWVGFQMVKNDQIDRAYYNYSIAARQNIDDKLLEWQTRDYILYDERESVFVYLLGVYSASQSYALDVGVGSLTVVLKIETPMGNKTVSLFSGTMNFSDILPDEELVSGVMYIPSPQLRSIFLPMYREQGDFKGAAYTTAEEVVNGAIQHCIINFELVLDTYAVVGSDYSRSPQIRFVPCNLLEMLYAYVFSTKYGKDDTEKYPVQYSLHYNNLMLNLFNKPFQVGYRDGNLVDWTTSFAGRYSSEKTDGVFRT